MRIISWNVNGIRAIESKGFLEWLYHESPDIICLQETKAEPAQVPSSLSPPKNYHSYYLGNARQKGMSGVGLLTKIMPHEVMTESLPELLREEGRVLAARFENFTLVNAYFPNSGMGEHRLHYKMKFNDCLLEHMLRERSKGYSVVLCGDLNAAHEDIDVADPDAEKGAPGFREEERAWIDVLLEQGFVDTYRHAHPDRRAYTWWNPVTRARDRNAGWRIDYVFVSDDLAPSLSRAFIQDHVYGSDHAPVGIELAL